MRFKENYKILLLGCSLLGLSATAVWGWFPDRHDDGVSIARSIFKSMANSPKDSACRMSYSVKTTVPVEDGFSTTESDILYLAGESRVQIITDRVQVYQDAVCALSVDDVRRQIFLSRSTDKELSARRNEVVAALQDSLFNQGKVLKYEDVRDDSDADKKLVLRIADGLREKLLIDTVSIWMNTKEKNLQRIGVRYVDGAPVSSVEVEYHDFAFIEKPDELKEPVTAQIFNADGTLRSEYKNYRLIDMRR